MTSKNYKRWDTLTMNFIVRPIYQSVEGKLSKRFLVIEVGTVRTFKGEQWLSEIIETVPFTHKAGSLPIFDTKEEAEVFMAEQTELLKTIKPEEKEETNE